MLKKLLKYDLKSKLPFLCIFYALAIGCALLSRLFGLFSEVPMVNILSQFFAGATISMIFNILINLTLRSWALFRQNLYGDPSYLMHTLPVEKKTLYLSKALDGLITLTVSFGVIGLTLLIQYYGTALWTKAGLFLRLFSQGRPAMVATLLIGILFLEIANMFQCGFTGLILGHKMNRHKMGYSVLAGLGVYAAGSLFVFAVIGMMALFNDSIRQFFLSAQTQPVEMNDLWLLIALSSAAYAFLILAMYFLNVKWLKQGVNVD